jgi:hypothetical protein
MRETEILPEVNVIDAILLFRRFGVDVTGMAADDLKGARRELIHRHHPDRGGDLNAAQSINAAYDLLKDGVPKYRGTDFALKWFRRKHQGRREQVAALKLCYPDHPEWAWAGYSGDAPSRPVIHNNDFTDINFIKKTMWELSGHSDIEYTIWGFDGRSFRGQVAVFATPKAFNYMADAMIMCQTKGSYRCDCRAVFAYQEESKNLFLIYADGKYYGDNPITMQCSCERDPEEDRDFVQNLPLILDRLRENAAA